MTTIERAEIRRLPEKYRPLTAWGYFWYSVLFLIPVIGLIALIICSASGKNISRRSFARSIWIAIVTFLIIAALVTVAVVVLMMTSPSIKEFIQGLFDKFMEAVAVFTK